MKIIVNGFDRVKSARRNLYSVAASAVNGGASGGSAPQYSHTPFANEVVFPQEGHSLN
jgi:hypothetical protein